MPEKLPVKCCCVPSSPFYVRWLNRFGGIDYWMFQKRQTLERKQDSMETFEPYIEDYAAARGTAYAASITASQSLVAGATLLSANEWFELSRIPFSPMVQYYDKKQGVWIDITVDKGESALVTDDPAQSIEISFVLPRPQLQF